MRSLFTILLAALWLAAPTLRAQTAASPPALSPPPGESKAQPKATATAPDGKANYREIAWDELVPKDWNPLKQFKDMNLGMLSDGDPRATAMLKRMRETWDNAPSNPSMDGQTVRIPGYVVPLDDSKAGLKEFLLVPYFGACIHTPPPPANQIILVTPKPVAKGFRSMDTVWVSGTLKTLRTDSFMGTSSYRIDAVAVEPYEEGEDKAK